jgi:hypothetical protein
MVLKSAAVQQFPFGKYESLLVGRSAEKADLETKHSLREARRWGDDERSEEEHHLSVFLT